MMGRTFFPGRRWTLRLVSPSHVVLVAAFLGLVLAACTDDGTAPRAPAAFGQDFSSITDPHERWQAYGIDTYRIEETRACECLPPYRWVALVRNGKLVDVELDASGGEGYFDQETLHAWALGAAWTVEDAFTRIERGDREADAIHVAYDPRFGFPSSIAIDWDAGLADEETYHTMSGLAPLGRP